MLNRYIDRIRAYEEDWNQTGVYYIYALIFRKIYIYNLPELDDDDFVMNKSDGSTTALDEGALRIKNGLQRVFTPNIEF